MIFIVKTEDITDTVFKKLFTRLSKKKIALPSICSDWCKTINKMSLTSQKNYCYGWKLAEAQNLFMVWNCKAVKLWEWYYQWQEVVKFQCSTGEKRWGPGGQLETLDCTVDCLCHCFISNMRHIETAGDYLYRFI